jgi:predicted RNase H-like HicB family nuclease
VKQPAGAGIIARINEGETLRREEVRMKYRVLIEPDEDGIFVAEVPSLPGCISQGRTRAEALANAKEAIAAYLESLEAHGEPVPPPITEELVEV